VDIRGKKFLVIGGAGLIGSHCVDELVKEDNVRLDLLPEANESVFDNQRQVCKGRFRGGALG
jgi:nucleoside-diphosphate-sugar epimerase